MEETTDLSVLLRAKMADEFENLSLFEAGSPEHSAAIDDLMSMYKVLIDETDRCYYKGPHLENELEFEKEKLDKELKSNKEKLAKELEFNKEKLEKEIDLKKQQFEQEMDIKKQQFERELDLKKEQFEQEMDLRLKEEECRKKQQMIDRIVDGTIKSAGIVLPLIFYGIWMKRGFKFEEEGTYTSQTFRGLFTRFRPTKVD